MHLGNVFSALLAWLSVRSRGGRMILRMEDLDPDRCRPEYMETLRDDLDWLGLEWDAGTDTAVAPDRTRTVRNLKSFRSWGSCTRATVPARQLHAASAPHASDGTAIYAGTCRNLTPEERAQKTRRPAWRVRVPEEEISFHDRLQGGYTENLARDCGDFIVRRSDGVYAYQLAVVTDDAEGGVTEIVRGRDLLSSSPRQIWLQRTLGFPAVEYCHVPLLVAPDGRRLSKRERDLDLGALRQRYTPEQLIGKLAALANLQPETAPVRAWELASRFSWEQVPCGNIEIHSEFG